MVVGVNKLNVPPPALGPEINAPGGSDLYKTVIGAQAVNTGRLKINKDLVSVFIK